MATFDVILLGGGRGHRFSQGHSADTPKQFQLLESVPLFVHAIRAFSKLEGLRRICFVVEKQSYSTAREQVEEYQRELPHLDIDIVVGGRRRQDSARLGIDAISQRFPHPQRILIHDACRPFLSPDFLDRIQDKIDDSRFAGWVPVVPISETLKGVENGVVSGHYDRKTIFRAQTPQIFDFETYRGLIQENSAHPEIEHTDDASLLEAAGIKVGVFEGDPRNIKLTYDFDREILRAFFRNEAHSCELGSVTTFTA